MAASEKRPTGFFLYPEHVRAVCAMLTPGDAGRLLLALSAYSETGEIPASRKRAFISCFDLLRADIDRDAARYREICEKNRERINRRWHPASPNTNEYAGIPPNTYPTQPIPTQPNPAQPNPAQPNTTQGEAAAAAPAFKTALVKGDAYDHSGNRPCPPSAARGTVL